MQGIVICLALLSRYGVLRGTGCCCARLEGASRGECQKSAHAVQLARPWPPFPLPPKDTMRQTADNEANSDRRLVSLELQSQDSSLVEVVRELIDDSLLEARHGGSGEHMACNAVYGE